MIFELLLVLTVLLVSRRWLRDLKYRHFPGPSPFLSLPIIGHGYMLGDDPAVKLMEMQKKYGDMFRLDIGDHPTIMLCKLDQVKEAFTKEVFSGRTWNEIPVLQAVCDKDKEGKALFAVASSEGSIWSEQRKFMAKNLSDLGVGNRDTMEDIIEQEAEQMAETFKKNNGVPFKSKNKFLTATNNVIWRIATGKRTRQDDPELLDLTARVVANFKNQDPSDPMCLLQFNSLSFTKLCRLLGMPNFLDSTKKVKEMVDNVVYKSTADESGNYVEKALSKRESDIAEKKDTFLSGNYAERLIAGQLMDLFFAGTETTSTMVEWTFMYLAKYPEYQERMFEEIKAITGDNERRIGLADKPNAHFCNAFTDEVSRHCQMATLPPAHKAMSDVYFQDKFIPKGTQICYCNYSMNHDESLFPNPSVFKPDRFLANDGTYVKDDHLVFFGLGKRRCPGELLARAETFLFVTRIVQQFKLSVPDPKSLSFTADSGLVFSPKPYDLCTVERENALFA